LVAAMTVRPQPEGLTAIRNRYDLFARGSEDEMRMVGAIRSVTQ
jgi:hypothetical protein